MTDVCRPAVLHSVAPCRTSHSSVAFSDADSVAMGHSLPGACDPRAARRNRWRPDTRQIIMKILLSAADDGDRPHRSRRLRRRRHQDRRRPRERAAVLERAHRSADASGTYPEFDATDYSFVLEQQCYCPLTGPVKVTVEDGEVTSAVIVKGGNGIKKGSEAPEYLHLTINDVIAHANDTSAAKIDVDWPEGQDWPSTVAVDQIENAVDDEVTYVIRDVRISG